MAAAHSSDWPRKVHSVTWYCDLGHHEVAEFDNEVDWRKHMTDLSLHPNRVKPPNDAQLDVLAVRKQQIALRDPFVCPFCEDKPQQIAVLGDRGNPADMMKILVNHISEHLKSLSFLSLPGLGEKDTGGDNSSANLEEDSAKRLRNSGSPPQPPSGVEFLEGVSLTFEEYDSESGREYTTNPSEHDVDSVAEMSIPETAQDFSWDFIPQHDVPLGPTDAAFKEWDNDGGGSMKDAEDRR